MKFKIQEKNMSPYLRRGRRSGAQGGAARVGESALAASISALPASVVDSWVNPSPSVGSRAGWAARGRGWPGMGGRVRRGAG